MVLDLWRAGSGVGQAFSEGKVLLMPSFSSQAVMLGPHSAVTPFIAGT